MVCNNQAMSTLPAKGYRTVGIETQIAWPAQERVVVFRGREFQLLPASDKLSRMIRVKTETGFTQIDADKLILELLSALAWAEQGGYEQDKSQHKRDRTRCASQRHVPALGGAGMLVTAAKAVWQGAANPPTASSR